MTQFQRARRCASCPAALQAGDDRLCYDCEAWEVHGIDTRTLANTQLKHPKRQCRRCDGFRAQTGKGD